MGIRYLNKLLKTKCGKSICTLHLNKLRGKTIVVDTSIYMYKFEGAGSLMEGMYSMLNLFNHYCIDAIFVFDGKPPPEKACLLQQRKNMKSEYGKQMKALNEKLTNASSDEGCSNVEISAADKQTLILLNKQCATINKQKCENVKNLITSFGMRYCVANGEADKICASFVINNLAWACLSDDTDMFVYSCPRVLRYFSVLNHSAVLYNFNGILEELMMTPTDFKKMCILSGTDYNLTCNNSSAECGTCTNLSSTDLAEMVVTPLQLWEQFTNGNHVRDSARNFDDLVGEYSTMSIAQISSIMGMFDCSVNDLCKLSDKNEISREGIMGIMTDHDFVFV